MPEPLLHLENVTAGYAQDIDVLRDVTLEVFDGQVSGLLAPKAGRIAFAGDTITGIEPHRLIDRGICCIPQESSLFPHLTVEENLLLPLQGRPRRFAHSAAKRYDEVLGIFPALQARRRGNSALR